MRNRSPSSRGYSGNDTALSRGRPERFPKVTWLRADLGFTPSQWNDQSGAAHHQTQGTGGNQPAQIVSDSGYNNKSTINFATDKKMSSGAWGVAQAQPFTTYVVGEAGSTANYRLYCGDTSTANGPEIAAQTADGKIYSQSGATTLLTTTTGQSKHIIGSIFNGASSSIFIDSVGTATTGNPGALSLNGLIVGDYFPLNLPLNGKIAELVIAPVLHSASQRSRLMQYMAARYGVALT